MIATTNWIDDNYDGTGDTGNYYPKGNYGHRAKRHTHEVISIDYTTPSQNYFDLIKERTYENKQKIITLQVDRWRRYKQKMKTKASHLHLSAVRFYRKQPISISGFIARRGYQLRKGR